MTNMMYIGPPIKGIVKEGQVFLDDPTAIKAKAAKISPLTKYLFVDMDDIVAAKDELERDYSFLDIVYGKVTKEVERWLTSTISGQTAIPLCR